MNEKASDLAKEKARTLFAQVKEPSFYREIPKALIFSHQEFIKHIKDIFNEKKFTVN
jgi:hypothetical protein